MTDLQASEPSRLRRYDPAETRTRVLEAAYQLFAVHGYAATGTAEIARLADVSEGSIFYHFRSKRGLLAELGRLHGQKLIATISGDDDIATISVETSIRRCFGFTEANAVRNSFSVPATGRRGGYRQLRNSPEGEIFFQASREMLVEWTTAHLAARAKLLGWPLPDPALSALLVFAVVREAAWQYVEPGLSEARRNAILDECVRFCSAAVGDTAAADGGAR